MSCFYQAITHKIDFLSHSGQLYFFENPLKNYCLEYEKIYSRFNFFAKAFAIVDFPDPAGPSIAIIFSFINSFIFLMHSNHL